MYRIVVKSRGKYSNAVLGARYCFTKRSVISLAIAFVQAECEFDIEKFIHIHRDVFCWSSSEIDEKIWNKIHEKT